MSYVCSGYTAPDPEHGVPGDGVCKTRACAALNCRDGPSDSCGIVDSGPSVFRVCCLDDASGLSTPQMTDDTVDDCNEPSCRDTTCVCFPRREYVVETNRCLGRKLPQLALGVKILVAIITGKHRAPRV